MYVPTHFRQADPAALTDFIDRYNFAILVTALDGSPFATHLPLLYEGHDNGVLLGHVARANPHAKLIAEGAESLAIFHGPHAYVSPTWYQDPKSVPTWNYTAVHVYGRPRAVEGARMMDIITRLTAKHEAAGSPYGVDANADWLNNLARGIVAFEMPIDRIEGKFKLSQNRPEADRAEVARRLAESESEGDRETARFMRGLL